MLRIKVLGPNCHSCHQLEAYTRQALDMLQPEGGYELTHVADFTEISKYVLMTPGLVINEKVVCAGRVPKPEDIMVWLTDALVKAQP